MDIDVRIGDESITINIEDPHRVDLDEVVGRIRSLGERTGHDLNGLDIQGLIPMMIRGVAGCEAGCPADARGLVRRGFDGFKLEYIEGGILSAEKRFGDGRLFVLKVFPEFG